jgi:nitroreductase
MAHHSDSSIAVLAGLIRSRRTNLRIDTERPVDDSTIAELCDLATWAPNHKLTEPWRFAALSGPARAELGRLAAEDLIAAGELNEGKIAKTRGKYLRAPVVVAVASDWADPARRDEDRDAVSAGIQNMLLGATALGLCSYWGTGPVTQVASVKQLCGFPSAADVVGFIYLGWPVGDVPTPQRAAPRLLWVR